MRELSFPLLIMLLLLAFMRAGLALAAPAAGAEGTPRVDPQPAATVPSFITPVPQVQDIIEQVDITRLMATVRELSGEQPALIAGQPYTIATRYTFATESLTMATEYAFERLERLGLETSFHDWTRNGQAFPPNVVAEKRSAVRPDDIVIIGAHIDSVVRSPADPALRAPGADDNASGSAAVLMAAELLAPYHFENTLRFVLFTGEEQGLWGSQAYAASVSHERIRGMLNLDMIAWDSQDGPDMDLHANQENVPASMDLAALFVDVVAGYDLNLRPMIYSSGTGASDHSSFWSQGFPAILAIENYREDTTSRDFNSYYHSIDDVSIHFNQDFFGEMTRAALAAFAHMGGLRSDCHWADLDCDCQIGVLDLALAAGRWDAGQGQWRYHRVYDADRNGSITIADVQAFAGQWGWTCQP